MELKNKGIYFNNSNNIILSNKSKYKTSTFSSNEYDIDKQELITRKKVKNGSQIILPKISKNVSQRFISINRKLINDLNHQINEWNKKVFGNSFNYKQTINLQELNDYVIYEQTKKNVENNKKKGIKNSVDFRIPLVYRRIANHFKKEDLIPMKIKPKINLEDILIQHNSILRKTMSKNNCRKYYLKKNIKLMGQNSSKKETNIKKC